MKSITAFIRSIQEAPLAVRKRWLVVFTVPTMVVVIALWAGYMRTAVGGEEVVVRVEASEVGIFQVMRAGVGVVGERVENGFHRATALVTGTLGSSRVIEIEVPQGPVNFVAEGLENIPETKLP